MTASSLIGRALGLSLVLACALLAGCDGAPGHAKSYSETLSPDAVREFAPLYRQNCSGCHGDDGEQGPAIDLSNPVYQALVDDTTLRRIIINGQPGTLMPAFGRSAGGLLADAQIDALVHGMRDHWQRHGTLVGQNPPPYAATQTGDALRGQQAYTAYCASCHGTGVQRGPKSSSVLDPSFLALVSDPALRTFILAGRPDLGMPDWRHNVSLQPDVAQPGHPMSDQEVTDVVTWMASQRSMTPGQPYPQHQ